MAMSISDIHPGDRLRIRQWDDMKAEFGLNNYRNIACTCIFTEEMRDICGKEFEVDDVGRSEIFPVITEETTYFSSWHISADMVEPADQPEPALTPVSVMDLLGGGLL